MTGNRKVSHLEILLAGVVRAFHQLIVKPESGVLDPGGRLKYPDPRSNRLAKESIRIAEIEAPGCAGLKQTWTVYPRARAAPGRMSNRYRVMVSSMKCGTTPAFGTLLSTIVLKIILPGSRLFKSLGWISIVYVPRRGSPDECRTSTARHQ